MTHFETIVVGNGLIGSAAGRYLSQLGEHVAIIGQAEPFDEMTHEGVFASHYDQRRLTHVTGRGGQWTTVKRNAVADYRALEAQAVGGNGGSAQCAAEWGKISAELIHSNHWSNIIPRMILQARFKGE